MNDISATSGNSGPKIRSDCKMTLVLKNEGGLNVDLESRVKTLYGSSIIRQCEDILEFYGIKNAQLIVDDSGALPFVISARLESAIKKLVKTNLDYLPEFREGNSYQTDWNRFRITRLYIPGNSPWLMINAGLHSADGIILDLEDSVAPDKKDEARILVRNALRQINFYGAERMVRINQGKVGLTDLEYVIPHNVNLILIPKCENRETVLAVEEKISEIKSANGLTNNIHLMPIIESALGIERSFDIARSSKSVVAMAIGLEDYTADLGVPRTDEGKETFYARTRLIVAAKASGIQPIDSVFSDVSDMDALGKNVLVSKALGFEGMGCIHPRQIRVIQNGFAPGEEEIKRAQIIISAYKDAIGKGVNVTTVGSKMIDPPVVARAQKILAFATRLGLITENMSDINH
jgi:citrate lyase subunit beta/citryl-CoA lyase